MKMKNLLFAIAAVAAVAALRADEPPAGKENAKDPVAPFNDYGPAMVSEAQQPFAVVWHNRHAEALEKAVSDETLAGCVKDDASAAALLSMVRWAYDTDALVSIQIAAVSQWVMTPKREAARKVWVNALMNRIEGAKDSYVKLFCLDQLRWCGCPCPELVGRIKAVEKTSPDKAVRDLAGIVLREIAGKGIGQ